MKVKQQGQENQEMKITEMVTLKLLMWTWQTKEGMPCSSWQHVIDRLVSTLGQGCLFSGFSARSAGFYSFLAAK